MVRCSAKTLKGTRCKNTRINGFTVCSTHISARGKQASSSQGIRKLNLKKPTKQEMKLREAYHNNYFVSKCYDGKCASRKLFDRCGYCIQYN